MSTGAKSPAIGIDLGTSNSCVAVWNKGNVHVIANEQGSRTTPSYVTFNDSERLYGDLAKNQVTKNPKRSVFNVKRLIGCRYTDPHVPSDINNVPFTVQEESGWPKIGVTFRREKRTFAPEEISAMILQKMKQIAETFIGEVKDAVISVPASFNDIQRRATIDAGTVAGLNVLRIINEPTAAAIAYGFDKRLKGKQNILVYDLGGGSFDVSIVEVEDGCKFVVKATAGDAHLGGLDFDNLLVEHLVDEFQRTWLADVTGNARAMQRLRSAAEKAKVILSSIPTTKIEIDSLIDGIDFNIIVSRDKLEKLCSELFNTTIKYVGKVIRDAKLDESDIHHVLLVGKSSRIPKIKSLFQDIFPGLEVNVSFNLEEAVASGAAVEAARLTGDPSERIQQLQLSDVSSKYSGIGGKSDVITASNTSNPFSTDRFHQIDLTIPRIVKAIIYEFSQDISKKKVEEVGHFEAYVKESTNGIQLCYAINHNSVLEIKFCRSGTRNQETKEIAFTYITGNSTGASVKKMMENAAKLQREEEVEKRRADARHQLERYAYSVKTDLSAVEAGFRNENWVLMGKWCQSALREIENKEDFDLVSIERQLTSLQTRYQNFQGQLSALIEERNERERMRNELQQFVEKELAEALELNLHESYIQQFMDQCDATQKWLTDNPSASKDDIDTQKQIFLTKKADLKVASNFQREEERRQLKAAHDELERVITFAENELGKVVDDTLKCPEWHKLKDYCNLTRVSMDRNMLKTKEQLVSASEVIKGNYNEVVGIIKKEIAHRREQKECEEMKVRKEKEIDEVAKDSAMLSSNSETAGLSANPGNKSGKAHGEMTITRTAYSFVGNVPVQGGNTNDTIEDSGQGPSKTYAMITKESGQVTSTTSKVQDKKPVPVASTTSKVQDKKPVPAASTTSKVHDKKPGQGASNANTLNLAANNESRKVEKVQESLRFELDKYIEGLERKDVYKSVSSESKKLVAYCTETLCWLSEDKDVTKQSVKSRMDTLKKMEESAKKFLVKSYNSYRR